MKIRLLILCTLFLLEVQFLSANGPYGVCTAHHPIFEGCIDLKKTDRPLGDVTIKAVLVICDHYATTKNNNSNELMVQL